MILALSCLIPGKRRIRAAERSEMIARAVADDGGELPFAKQSTRPAAAEPGTLATREELMMWRISKEQLPRSASKLFGFVIRRLLESSPPKSPRLMQCDKV